MLKPLLVSVVLGVTAAAVADGTPDGDFDSSLPTPMSSNAAPAPDASIASVSTGAHDDANPWFVEPEVSTPVKVSNRDVNRVHCAGAIDDVIWSNEKPMSVSPTKNGNVFVKFLVRRQADREVATTLPADLHVVCNGQVYTMILYPKPVDSVTIHLGRGADAATLHTVTEQWGALALEDRVKRMTLAMYREETPPGFSRTATRGERRDVQFYQGLSVQGLYEMRAPGLGLNATEYRVVAAQATTLDERDFLLPQLGNVVGITLDPTVLTADRRVARLIVIERESRDAR